MFLCIERYLRICLHVLVYGQGGRPPAHTGIQRSTFALRSATGNKMCLSSWMIATDEKPKILLFSWYSFLPINDTKVLETWCLLLVKVTLQVLLRGFPVVWSGYAHFLLLSKEKIGGELRFKKSHCKNLIVPWGMSEEQVRHQCGVMYSSKDVVW